MLASYTSNDTLFQKQRQFFETEGLDAWNDVVPYYATSNSYVGDISAEWALSLISDWSKVYDKIEPFYIIEWGSGLGLFAFHTLNALKKKIKNTDLDAKIIYVMTDFASKNIDFYRQNESLKPFIDIGLLDFSHVDLLDFYELSLLERKVTLGQPQNPVTVFANYVFDTLPNESFFTKGDMLYKTSFDNDHMMDEFSLPSGLKDGYDKVLREHRENLKKSHFLLPTGSFQTLDNLSKFADRFCLFANDRGYTSYGQMKRREKERPEYYKDGFSLSVNFKALSSYMEFLKGESHLLSQSSITLKSYLFQKGLSREDFLIFKEKTKHRPTPGEYFELYRHARDRALSQNALLAFLKLSCFDLRVLGFVLDTVREDKNRRGFLDDVLSALKEFDLKEQIYLCPNKRYLQDVFRIVEFTLGCGKIDKAKEILEYLAKI